MLRSFALAGVLAVGGGPFAAVGSALLLGTLNTVYGLRLTGLLSYRGWLRVVAAHWVIDETTAITVAQRDQKLARLAFLSSGASLLIVWNLTTVAGALGAQFFGPVPRAALDSVVPAAIPGFAVAPTRTGRHSCANNASSLSEGAVIALALTPVLAPRIADHHRGRCRTACPTERFVITSGRVSSRRRVT